MIKKVFIVLIAFELLIVPCFADFRFAVMGDTRDRGPSGINVRMMKLVLKNIKAENADFVIVTGDMITGSAKTDIHRGRLRKWKSVIEKYLIPFYVSAGNHEVESGLSENIMRSVFEMPENGPERFKELVYSFDYKNAHFIILDTAVFNNFHMVGKAQIEWLKEDFKKNQIKNIFVFGHDPAYPVYSHIGSSLDKYSAERDELWGLFEQYNVRAYFCGHEHLYNKTIHNGVYQIITAGGGARLVVPEEKGGFNHFIIVNVKDSGAIDMFVKDVKGNTRDEFSLIPLM